MHISTPGRAICLLCNSKFINYGSQGLVGNYVIEKSNCSLPNASSVVAHHPYGIHPNHINFSIETPVPVPRVQNHERALNQEALIFSYVVERNRSFSCACEIVGITKELSKDHKALQCIELFRTTVAYKLPNGVVVVLKTSYFCHSSEHLLC